MNKKRIKKILDDGVKEKLTTNQIINRILAETEQKTKKTSVSIEELEELLKNSKQLIQESKKILYKSASGS